MVALFQPRGFDMAMRVDKIVSARFEPGTMKRARRKVLRAASDWKGKFPFDLLFGTCTTVYERAIDKPPQIIVKLALPSGVLEQAYRYTCDERGVRPDDFDEAAWNDVQACAEADYALLVRMMREEEPLVLTKCVEDDA